MINKSTTKSKDFEYLIYFIKNVEIWHSIEHPKIIADVLMT